MIVVIYYYQFGFQRATRENTFYSHWCHLLKINNFFFFMTKDEACSSSASESGITNMAYLNQGEKKEENEEGNGKGQEGWQKTFFNHLAHR